jgi:hypothetical protein
MPAPTKSLQQGGEQQAALGIKVEEVVYPPEPPLARGWTRNDIDDVSRIGTMIGSFLGAEAFHSEMSFHEIITKHLRRREISFGSVERLQYLMNSLMVKHR